jgi:hypothetical protein
VASAPWAPDFYDRTAGTKISCGVDIPGATLIDKKKDTKRTTHFSGFTFVLQTAS